MRKKGNLEKFVLRFNNYDITLKFKSSFQDAKEFNLNLKKGGELKFAPLFSLTSNTNVDLMIGSRSLSFSNIDDLSKQKSVDILNV